MLMSINGSHNHQSDNSTVLFPDTMIDNVHSEMLILIKEHFKDHVSKKVAKTQKKIGILVILPV